MKPLGFNELVATIINGNELQKNAIFLIWNHATDYTSMHGNINLKLKKCHGLHGKSYNLLNELLDKIVLNFGSVASR